jgi:hypothetical protein
MADFSILTEVVPELRGFSADAIGLIYRTWLNAPEQDDIRMWMTREMSLEERLTFQQRFADSYYRKAAWRGASSTLVVGR